MCSTCRWYGIEALCYKSNNIRFKKRIGIDSGVKLSGVNGEASVGDMGKFGGKVNGRLDQAGRDCAKYLGSYLSVD